MLYCIAKKNRVRVDIEVVYEYYIMMTTLNIAMSTSFVRVYKNVHNIILYLFIIIVIHNIHILHYSRILLILLSVTTF